MTEVESWVWVLFNEPGGVNAFSNEWRTGQGNFSYYDMFFNTSIAIKSHSRKIQVRAQRQCTHPSHAAAAINGGSTSVYITSVCYLLPIAHCTLQSGLIC